MKNRTNDVTTNHKKELKEDLVLERWERFVKSQGYASPIYQTSRDYTEYQRGPSTVEGQTEIKVGNNVL